ncbi:MAG TPA: XRE family transcriptional regulator, partial [Ruminococcaceae bacterium]|nr:XRE family transcriptional regulator [Oscillospiraceae bacterium]
MDALAKELVPFRAKIGLSQSELANLVGISRQTYS